MAADIAGQAFSLFGQKLHLLHVLFAGAFVGIGIAGAFHELDPDKGFAGFIGQHSRVPGFILVKLHATRSSKQMPPGMFPQHGGNYFFVGDKSELKAKINAFGAIPQSTKWGLLGVPTAIHR